MSNMTEARVFELIEAYGPEPEAWPDAERDAARTFLLGAPSTFKDAIAEARLLESALAAIPEPQAPAGLAERIIASAPLAEAKTGHGIFFKLKSMLSIGGSIIPSASALASAAVGMVIGYGALGATQIASIDSVDEAMYAAFDGGYEEFDFGALN